MAENVTFAPANWNISPADPNDHLLGQVVTFADDAPSPRAILYGLPFDGAVLGRKGAWEGPAAIRKSARLLKAPPHAADGDIVDLGDAHMPGTVAAAHEVAEAAAREARKAAGLRTRVITLGGDHSLAYPAIKPYLDEFGDALAVVNLDAHLDIRHVLPQREANSGTAFGQLLEAGLRHYVVAGTRRYQNSEKYLARAAEHRVSIASADYIHDAGAARFVRELFHVIPRSCRCIYLSVDLDVADASVAPGVSAPTPGGLFAHQIFAIVRALCADPRTRAAGIFELAPNLEEPHSDRTARLAAGCLAEMIYS